MLRKAAAWKSEVEMDLCGATCVDWEKKKQNCWCRGESGDKSPETPRLDPSMSSHFVADHQSQL